MSNHNRLGGLKREFHHLKVMDGTPNQKAKFERGMMLVKPALKGRSFWVPDSCGWKYLDPVDNADAHEWDVVNFADLMNEVAKAAKFAPFGNYQPEMEAFRMASLLYHRSRFLRCTTYSLVKCCQLLDITVDEQAIYQLLNFIQDGLRELQTMTLPLPEEAEEVGDARLTLHRGDDVKTWDEPLMARAGELKTGIIQ